MQSIHASKDEPEDQWWVLLHPSFSGQAKTVHMHLQCISSAHLPIKGSTQYILCTHVTLYTRYCVHTTVYTRYCVHTLLCTHVTVYTRYCVHTLLCTHVTVYTCYSVHTLLCTHVTVYTHCRSVNVQPMPSFGHPYLFLVSITHTL